MKKLKNQIIVVLAIIVAGAGTTYAQNFEGIATYQAAANAGWGGFQVKGIASDMEKQLAEAMKKQIQKEYILNFNLRESNWKEVGSLDKGPATDGAIASVSFSGGMSVNTSGSNIGIKYRNTADNLYLEEANLGGKAFLVKDELKNLAWELTGETKKIGDYTAQKAVYSRVAQRSMMVFGYGSEGDGKPKMITDTIKVVAWYTPEIPVSHGPDNYWGLPGLILQVSDGRRTLLCTKVILNPEDGVKIKKPKKGKKVNREEYAEIKKAKFSEMQNKYSGGGNGRLIRVGGGR